MKRNTLTPIAALLLLVMAVALPPGRAGAAAPPPVTAADALNATITGYYQADQQYVLDDWEELAAVYAAGEKLTEYVLPATQTGTASTTIITALIKGDMAAAQHAAQSMVTEGALVPAGGAYEQALNMIALEAYNRSATDPHPAISYDQTAAVNELLSFQSDGIFLDWGEVSHDNAALALVALALYPANTAASDARRQITAGLRAAQRAEGGFASWGAHNANTTAVALGALTAVNADLDRDWTSAAGHTPLDALLNSFYVPGGGFGWDNNTALNPHATKQATLALAENVTGRSFFTTLRAAPTRYLSVTVQAVDAAGDLTARPLTVTAGATVSDAIARAWGQSSVDSDAYRVFANGALTGAPDNYMIADGDTILAIHKNFNAIAWFQASPTDPLGVNEAPLNFGGVQELTLVQTNASGATLGVPTALSGIPVDHNGDGYRDVYTDANGQIAVSPIAAGTHTITALAAEYSSYYPYTSITYIAPDVALLPARIIMAAGNSQSVTVSLRIEGVSANLLYDSAFTAANDGRRRLTVYDAATQALDSAGIPYTAAGGYFSTINGETAGQAGNNNDGSGWDGWVYNIIKPEYLNGSAYVGGMTDQLIAEGDEIVVYYGDYAYTTVYPAAIDTVRESDGDVTVTLRAWQYDADFNCVLLPLSGVTVDWSGGVTAWSGVTDADGQVTVPAAYAPAGSHALQISQTDSYGLPSVVRLAPGYLVTVSGGGAQADPAGSSSSLDRYVYLTVTGPQGTLYARQASPWYSGITPLALLKGSGLTVTSDTSGYVSAVENIAEFDYGANSGWLFKVNGDQTITRAANAYPLSAGDQVEWFYSRDYTAEQGSAAWGGAPSAAPGGAEAAAAAKEETFAGPAATGGSGAVPTFADVPAAHWAHDDIIYLAKRGVVTGQTAALFMPEASITRAEFVALLARVSADAPAEGAPPFVDVAPDAWYAPVVAWGLSSGVAAGVDAGHFAPDTALSRQDMAVMLVRWVDYMGLALPPLRAPADFADQAQIAAYARDAVGRLQVAGIIHGREGNMFAPDDSSTRAEAAALLARLLRGATPESPLAPDVERESKLERDAEPGLKRDAGLVRDAEPGLKQDAGLERDAEPGLVRDAGLERELDSELEQDAEQEWELMIEQTAAWLLAAVPEPQLGATGGEWAVLGLARSGAAVPAAWVDKYYANLTAYAVANGGVLHPRKNTEYARAVMALTALGYDPADVGGYDLLAPLYDYEPTIRQGLNGAIFALIALDCGDYAPPSSDGAAIREQYLQYILERQLADGGFGLSGAAAEADITAMALQALAAYRDEPAVKDAVAAALARLSQLQNADGSFTGWGKSALESSAQALIALGELGIAADDPRFMKNGHSITDYLSSYYDADAGFTAGLTRAGDGQMSLEQFFIALVSHQRLQTGRSSLYDMSDVERL